jgi:phage protein D
MPQLSELEGEDLINELGKAPFDPFSPVIAMTPVAGFPRQVSTLNGLGETIFISARDRLTRFVVTDNDRKLDKIEMTFIDEDGFFADPANLAHGSVIDVAFGYKGKLSSERRLIVRRLQLQTMQGKASTKRRKGFIVSIEGQAPGIVGLLDDGLDVEVFENTRLSAIVRVVAGRLGYHETGKGGSRLEINIPPEDDIVERVLTKPAAMKMAQFIKYIADRYGFIICTSKKGMYFGIRDYNQRPGQVIDAHNSTLLSYNLDGDLNLPIPKGLIGSGVQKGSFTQVRFRANADDQAQPSNTDYTADEGEAAATTQPKATGLVEAVPGFQQTGALQIATRRPVTVGRAIRKRNTVVRDYRPILGGKAQIVRIKKFKQRIEKLWKLKIRTVGNPEFVAGTVVSLTNFDTPLLNGVWYITEAKHMFDQNYQTELTMRRRRSKTKRVAPGRAIQTIFRNKPRNKAEEDLTFGVSANNEPVVRGGLQIITGAKRSHRTESGTYADVTQRKRGCK